eukprot:CAMPEP_0206605412 /NCGR_PEP_ID=MMETSP0325_2-20121206/50400_1 /ASSEMBLY_ACC=CAM_ASM_000347 /TAXON_ID=2866 /ORGANISM="Crypthecodinium cohnii, Strain Seligo" /LENGTH=224 /DNA_ID=CAMNT_0054120951 /DNA_START=111 /DNA_END=785 /DNA_ORIENTATION=-
MDSDFAANRSSQRRPRRLRLPLPRATLRCSPPLSLLLLLPLLQLLFLQTANAAKATSVQSTLQTLTERDLICGSCRYIFEPVDEWVKASEVGAMSQKKARKWLKKKMAKDSICASSRFSDRMGVGHRVGKYPPRLVEDAVQFARGSGFGHKDPTELKRVADGTHEELRRDRTVGPYVMTACFYWLDGLLEPLSDALEDLLMDGRGLMDFVCNDHLKVCENRDEL